MIFALFAVALAAPIPKAAFRIDCMEKCREDKGEYENYSECVYATCEGYGCIEDCEGKATCISKCCDTYAHGANPSIRPDAKECSTSLKWPSIWNTRKSVKGSTQCLEECKAEHEPGTDEYNMCAYSNCKGYKCLGSCKNKGSQRKACNNNCCNRFQDSLAVDEKQCTAFWAGEDFEGVVE
jgi:hypothetical protein